MACRGHRPVGDGDQNYASSEGGLGRPPSRGSWLRMGAALLLALALASLGSVAANRETAPAPSQPTPAASSGAERVQAQVAPAPGSSPSPDRQPSEEATAPDPPSVDLSAPDPAPADPAPTDRPMPTSSTVGAPATEPSSSTASPTPVPPAPAPPPEPPALRLAREASERFGIHIVLEGQDWGPDEASQVTNIGAVISVMERLPSRVTAAVVAHRHGPLTFVSNRQGRTLDGWQPYGDFPIGFYTNSDQGPDGNRPANQVVLIPGFSDMSICHEVLHAYQLRDVGPDQYVLALLGDEMRSFMAASGWRQVGTDEQVREAADDPWQVVNGLYVYEGRPLTYTTVAGDTVTLNPPNPLEAFAVAGSIYYTRPAGMPLPDWPEYWAWFDENLG